MIMIIMIVGVGERRSFSAQGSPSRISLDPQGPFWVEGRTTHVYKADKRHLSVAEKIHKWCDVCVRGAILTKCIKAQFHLFEQTETPLPQTQLAFLFLEKKERQRDAYNECVSASQQVKMGKCKWICLKLIEKNGTFSLSCQCVCVSVRSRWSGKTIELHALSLCEAMKAFSPALLLPTLYLLSANWEVVKGRGGGVAQKGATEGNWQHLADPFFRRRGCARIPFPPIPTSKERYKNTKIR